MAHILIDCDTGVDDAVALTVALRSPGVHVEAITCVAGNSRLENVLRNTISVVAVNERVIPVYAGCRHSLLHRKHTVYNAGAEGVHGENGFGGLHVELSEKDWQMLQKEHAASALCRLAKEQPKKMSLVALAPLTNIAVAMRLDPDFTSKLKEIVIMGGNYKEPASEIGGAEFNFFMDAEAADVVLREALCPVTIVPFDTCERSCNIPWEWFKELVAPPSLPRHGRLIGDIMSPFSSNWPLFDPCDAVAMVAALDKGAISEAETYKFLAVNTESMPHAGEGYGCLLRHEGSSDSSYNGNGSASAFEHKHIFNSVPPRTIVGRIDTSEIKRRLVASLT